jgi:glycine/D-amino acid oxidase-like deaminating enzyme
MVKFAKDLGVTVYTNTRVTAIKLSAKGDVKEVITDKGSIKTELVINAAGLWAPRIAAMAGLYFPTTPVDHQHIALKGSAWSRVQCKDAVLARPREFGLYAAGAGRACDWRLRAKSFGALD